MCDRDDTKSSSSHQQNDENTILPQYKDQVLETSVRGEIATLGSNSNEVSRTSIPTADKGKLRTGAGFNKYINTPVMVAAVAIMDELPSEVQSPSNEISDLVNISTDPTSTDEESGYPSSAKEPVHHQKRIRLYGILGICVAAIIAAIVSVVVVVGKKPKGNESASNVAPAPPIQLTTPPTTMTPMPTSTPTEARQGEIVAYINSIKFSDGDITYANSGSGTTAESRAVKWLIDQDPLVLSPDTANGQFRLRQRYALLTLWFQEETPSWTNISGWLTNEDECLWYGVFCEEEFVDDYFGVQNVVLDLYWPAENNMQGNITVDLALLNSTTSLVLQSQEISGTIPYSLWSMTKLTLLDLAGTSIQGTISPLISQLKDLNYLDLSSPSLTGTIPGTLWNLSKLTFLILAGVPAQVPLQGTMPVSVGSMLKDLVALDLYQVNFTGTIPESLWDLTKLEYLDVGSWEQASPFPSLIGNLQNLSMLSLPGSHFTGSIPEEMWALSKLTHLDLSSLNVSGTIPDSIGFNMSSLVTLNLHSNRLIVGSIPESLWSLSNLTYLRLTELGLSPGPLPESISKLSNLDELHLSKISLTGSLPASIGQLTKIHSFSVAFNSLTGTLPETMGAWTGLVDFSVISNGMNGTIPQSFANWESLEKADFYGNHFTGTMPSELCTMNPQTVLQIDCPGISCDCCYCGPDR